MEAEEGGGGSSRKGGGREEADLRVKPRGNRPAEAEAAEEVAHGAFGFPAPSARAEDTPRHKPTPSHLPVILISPSESTEVLPYTVPYSR